MLLFIVTIILNALKDNAGTSTATNVELNEAQGYAAKARWNSTNETVDTLNSFLTIGTVLLGVLGITMIGASIIGYISGAFGG